MSRSHRPNFRLLSLTIVACLWGLTVADYTAAAPRKATTPFNIRFRVNPEAAAKIGARERTTMTLLGGNGRMTAVGDQWSPGFDFDKNFAAKVAASHPNNEIGPEYPLMVRARLTPERADNRLEIQVRWAMEEAPAALAHAPDATLRLDLLGSMFMLMIGHDAQGKPLIQTTAEYNRRYWPAFKTSAVPVADRPKLFPIVDQFSVNDADRATWSEAAENMALMGITGFALGHNPSAAKRELMLKNGLHFTADGDHWPPGGYFDHNPAITADAIRKWAQEKAEAQRAAGFAPGDVALFAMADEPAWAYPRLLDSAAANQAVLTRFHDYLAAQGLMPADVGAATWDGVLPIGRSKAIDPPSRRLFYWSMRFFSWDSTRHFAQSTRALEAAFRPGQPVFANWATHSGRFYIPGGFGGNTQKDSPDAAQGCHDWFEFARMRGSTMLWIEDWFGDARAWQWSFYCSKFNSAARKNNIGFGGYIIGRTCGARADGILQRILTIIGSGGKAIKYFLFGPEYNFARNCYSEKSAQLLPKMAEAHAMIGKAEDLLWPGQRPQAQVAIVAPRSAQVWDALRTTGSPIRDAGNPQIDNQTVDYMSEIFCLYLALQHANIPVDWVEEDDLSTKGLAGYRVVYLTEPDLPAENARGLTEWVAAGGTLVTVSAAASGDRYGMPCRVLSDFSGIVEAPRERLLIEKTRDLPTVAEAADPLGDFAAVGVRGVLTSTGHIVKAAFKDGTPAVVEQSRGLGRIVHYPWMPGMSYLDSSHEAQEGLPAGFSSAIRKWIAYPVQAAGVKCPVAVNVPMVETPVLLSPGGAAITLLNWTGKKQTSLQATVELPFEVKHATAVKAGDLKLTKTAGGVAFALPLDAADIVMLRP